MKWEYLIVTFESGLTDGGISMKLERFGREGWECFCVEPVTNRYYLKRPSLESIAEQNALAQRKEKEGT